MKVRHTLICFFFLSALQDGHTKVTSAQMHFYGLAERSITIECHFSSSKKWKIFCKEKCEEGNILIETQLNSNQHGRYSTEYRYEYKYILSVSIRSLIKSDSGRYTCGLGRYPSSYQFIHFGIVVAEALLDGNDDQLKHFDKETGSSLTVACSFEHSARRKYFCRGECERDGILIETQGARAQRDRYSAEYEKESGTSGILYVTIKQLRESDSGRYRCYLDTSFSTDPYREFEITVTEVLPSASTPPSTFTGTTEQSERTASTDVVPFVGLTLALIIILLSVSVLIFCKNRSSKPKDPPVGTEHAAVTETNTVYENIRAEGRHSRSPPDSHAKYTKPTNDDHSLVAAATSQHKTGDDSSKLTYSVVTFSKKSSDSANSTSRSNTSDVIYSEPRVNASHSGGDPLYSIA
ncbi:uncharacterized protein LOC120728127 isoform X5 [Simochromis diagramma]|uniref:uncharacterized protein LOC120728127 isoform X5 n=1 Tax=Simochromis diagramma TaxID=43689 RepID=UPI001A7EDB8A|nr:uncharacterized protein LOC120728127 isoform X5 [Simochromis diagramma]